MTENKQPPIKDDGFYSKEDMKKMFYHGMKTFRDNQIIGLEKDFYPFLKTIKPQADRGSDAEAAADDYAKEFFGNDFISTHDGDILNVKDAFIAGWRAKGSDGLK